MNSELLYYFWVPGSSIKFRIVEHKRIWCGPSGVEVISEHVEPLLPNNWLISDKENTAVIQRENDSLLLLDRYQFVPIVCSLIDTITFGLDCMMKHCKVLRDGPDFDKRRKNYSTLCELLALKQTKAINCIRHFMDVRETLLALPQPIFEEIYMYFANPTDYC